MVRPRCVTSQIAFVCSFCWGCHATQNRLLKSLDSFTRTNTRLIFPISPIDKCQKPIEKKTAPSHDGPVRNYPNSSYQLKHTPETHMQKTKKIEFTLTAENHRHRRFLTWEACGLAFAPKWIVSTMTKSILTTDSHCTVRISLSLSATIKENGKIYFVLNRNGRQCLAFGHASISEHATHIQQSMCM